MSDQPASLPTPVQTAFFVVVDTAGVISVHTNGIPSVTVSREATLNDIETYTSQLLRTVSRLVSAQAIAQALSPVPPTVADRVSDALKKRSED